MGGQHSNCAHPKSKCYHAGSPKAQVVRVAPPELTSKQKQQLRTAWDQLERDIADVGIITFLGMFETHPQVQDIFMPFVGLAKTDEHHSKTLRQHALRVMATVEKCIHRLDEPERMRTVLEALGARHINYNAKIEYVDVLGSQFVKAVKQNSAVWNDDLENAWLSLVRILTFYVKHGWMDKQKQQVTREVVRKEYLAKKPPARADPTVSEVPNPPAKQANGGPADHFSDAVSSATNRAFTGLNPSGGDDEETQTHTPVPNSSMATVILTASTQDTVHASNDDQKEHSQA